MKLRRDHMKPSLSLRREYLKLQTRLRGEATRWRESFRSSQQRKRILVGFLTLLMLAGITIAFKPAQISCDSTSRTAETASGSTFTVIINTFKRPERLKNTIRSYEKCPAVEAIRVVWSEQTAPPRSDVAEDADFFSACVEVIYDTKPTTSLNNRFMPLEGLRTEAVFNVDDDVEVTCNALKLAHKVWLSNKRQLVGYIPRIHIPDVKNAGKWIYRRWWTVWLTGQYSIILTKACFMHRDYLDLYSNQVPKDLLLYVEQQRNCEDILMQFAVSNATRLPPVWVAGSYVDTGWYNGISTTGGHANARSDCVDTFAAGYGYMPLVSGNSYVLPAEGWATFFSIPSWLEYFAF